MAVSITPPAAQRNVSDGSREVWASIAFATLPSSRYGLIFSSFDLTSLVIFSVFIKLSFGLPARNVVPNQNFNTLKIMIQEKPPFQDKTYDHQSMHHRNMSEWQLKSDWVFQSMYKKLQQVWTKHHVFEGNTQASQQASSSVKLLTNFWFLPVS